MIDYRGIVDVQIPLLQGDLIDESLEEYFQNCFQQTIEQGELWPSWVCMTCRHVDMGEKPNTCSNCDSENVFSIATFQGRAPAFGNIFEEAVQRVIDERFADLGIEDSAGTEFQDHCDLYVPEIVGIELKGSASEITLPDGHVVTFNRPGMQRSDTEKKANSNADTFKNDYLQRGIPGVRFYVLTNAVPDGWQEAGSNIDGIFNVTEAGEWTAFRNEIENDIRRAERNRRGRR